MRIPLASPVLIIFGGLAPQACPEFLIPLPGRAGHSVAMHSSFSRRDFLKLSPSLAFALSTSGALAVEPFTRSGPSRLPLSLAAYSFRQHFKDSSHEREKETDPAKRIDLFQFVDYCAAHGCDGAELTAYYFPKDVDDTFLLKLRRHCFLRGVEVLSIYPAPIS